MIRIRSILVVTALLPALGAACGGIECTVAGTREQFASCEAIQEKFDAEQGRNDGADARVLRDLDTCAAINDCEVRP